MKLIVLYGPPAAGKYTVAKAVAAKTGYRLFHNHLTVDMLLSVFDFGTPGFFQLCNKIRLDVLEQAAKENIAGIVFTFVYEKEADDEFIAELRDRMTARGGEVVFIRLICDADVLEQRVTQTSRAAFHKLKSGEGLRRLLAAHDLKSSIDFVDGMEIDTTHLTADETVVRVLALLDAPSSC